MFRFPSQLFHWSRTVTDRAKAIHYLAMEIRYQAKLSAKSWASVMDLSQARALAWDEDPGPVPGQAHVLLSA